MTIKVSAGSGIISVSEPTRFGHIWNRPVSALNGEIALYAGAPESATGLFNNQGVAASWAKVDGRFCKVVAPNALVQGRLSEVRPNGGIFPLSFRPTFANGGAGGLAFDQNGEPEAASVFQAWLKKVNNVDLCSARQGFFFYNNNAAYLGSSAVPSRVGLFGDGAVGFRFGSIGCPDGAAGVSALGAIDVGSVQPAGLVVPGLSWFHVRLKLIPATPSSSGKVACYLNGRLIVAFDQVANLPRGSNGAALAYSPIGAAIAADFDGATQLNGFHSTDEQFYFDKDLSI